MQILGNKGIITLQAQEDCKTGNRRQRLCQHKDPGPNSYRPIIEGTKHQDRQRYKDSYKGI